jgi:hypothetical protein
MGVFQVFERFRTSQARVRIYGIAALGCALLTLSPRLLVPNMYRGGGQPWEHRMEAEGVALQLPSPRWTVLTKKVHLVDFGSPPGMLAGVSAVQPATEEEFETAAAEIRSRVSRLDDSKVEAGTTAAGDRFVMGTFRERAVKGSALIFVATGHVWLRGSQKMVTLVFEGHPTLMGQTSRAIELEEMATAARAIFSSVHG